MKRGMKQGDSVSPLLFTVFMDSVLKHCKRRTPKLKIGNWKVRPVHVETLVYADDVVLVVDTQRDLQVSVTEWTSTFSERGLEVNINKSKVMKMCRENEEEEEINIEWKQQKLDIVEEISYLGVVKCSNGKIDAEINNRIGKANQICYQINNTGIGKKEVQTETKMQLCKSVCVPILSYAAESWATTSKNENRITVAEMKFLRRSLGKTRRDMQKCNSQRSKPY
jgi:hypothetical protein